MVSNNTYKFTKMAQLIVIISVKLRFSCNFKGIKLIVKLMSKDFHSEYQYDEETI